MANPIKFTELPLAGELSSSAIVAIVQEQNGEQVSLKCSVAQVAQLIADGIEFAGLTSNDKRIIGAINEIMNKVDDLELFKFPNATIIGTPTINNGQISGFSQTSYLQFPFLMDFQGRHFAINMEFTTAADVTNQQNIFDSDFGLAFAIRSGKFVIAVSSNGTSWNIGEGVGTHTVIPNTTYRVQLAWDGTAYKLAYSVNGGESYTEDISLVSTASPFPKQVYIGVGENYAAVLNFFKGIINLNYASLYVADSLVWQGMDDVGLASRLATDLSNIDAAGEQRIKDIAGGGGGASIDDSKIATDSTWSSSKINSELGTVKSDLTELDDKLSNLGEISPNMFDKNSDNLLNGYFSNQFNSNSGYRMTHPIKLKGGVTYKYPQSSSLGGNTQVPYFRNEGEEISTAYLSGTLSNGFVTITFGIDVWARFNIGRVADLDTFMVCEADKYPDRYWDYGAFNIDKTVNAVSEVLSSDKIFDTNPLLNKKVVFDGDSISYGQNDNQGRGWGSRIGTNNKMNWQNVSASGGSIAEIPNRHNLCTYIDTIYNNNPTLDYFIFDGGTNDADVLGADGLGEIATITYAGQQFPDFTGNYNTATFCGGFETLLFKALQYYPKSKIGYIVAPKSGVWGGSSVNAMLTPKIRETYLNKAKEICKKWGVSYIDLWEQSTLNPCLLSQFDRSKSADENIALGHPFSVDAQHPNYMGYDMITPIIESWMKTL